MCLYRFRRWDCGTSLHPTEHLRILLTYSPGCKEKYLTYRCGYADRPNVGKGHEYVWQKDIKGKDIYEHGECPNGCMGYVKKKANPNDDDTYWRVRLYNNASGWKKWFYR